MAKDLYEVLGVSRDANEDEIKKAFRRRARELHPDVNKAANAEEQFKELNEAAEVLCDPALIEQAALKETSLFTLATRCGIAPPEDFVKRFIDCDREVREDGR